MEGELRYHPDADQQALAGAFNETIAALLPITRLREIRVEKDETLASLEESGLFTLAVSEGAGGSGLSATEEALILLAVGRQLASPGIIATIGAYPALSATVDLSEGKTPRVASAYRRDGRIILIDGQDAELILVRDVDHAALYRSSSADTAVIDARSWLSELNEVSDLGAQLCSLSGRDLLRLRLIDAATLAGIADGALATAVDYAGVREQFGRPIGTFQAIKHHAADMAIAARCARDQVSFAAVAFDQGRDDMALQIESALLVAGNAALGNAGKNIQIHGGMGFSDEADPHLFLKRAQLFIAIAGGLEAAAERIAAIKPMVADGR